MNLDEYYNKIFKPMLFKHIEQGKLDMAIQSDDCQDIIDCDEELKVAIENRLKILNKVNRK